MKFQLKDLGKGLNADAAPYELAPGYCSNASNVRFRNGFAERIHGTVFNKSIGATATWMGVLPSSLSATGYYDVLSSATDAYAYPFTGSVTTITRFTEGVVISSITRVATTATLTTATNHGRTTGDTVSVWGASPSQYNGTFVITVTGVTTYTYTMASDPGASASPVGLYSYNGATSTFTGTLRATGGNLNGVFLLNKSPDGLYYWAGNTAVRMRKVPLSYAAKCSRPFGNYVVQLAPTIAGVDYPNRVLWSSATEPGSIPSAFDASSTNDAGLVDLMDGDDCIDSLPLGDVNIIYKKYARYAMQYIGGNDVFRFTKLPGTDGVLSTDCVVDTPVGHVFLNRNFQVLVHSGGACKNISEGRVSSLISYSTSLNRFFMCRHSRMNEVWIFVMSGSSTYPQKALIWNWIEDTWGVMDFGGDVQFAFSGGGLDGAGNPKEELYLASSTSLYNADITTSVTLLGASTYTSFIERAGMDLGDSDTVKNLQRSRWKFDADSGATFSIQHGSSMSADTAPTYQSAATYTVGTTDYVNSRATGGRFLAVKVSWSLSVASPNFNAGRVRSSDLDLTAGGKR